MPDVASIIFCLIFSLWVASAIWFVCYLLMEDMAVSVIFTIIMLLFILIPEIYSLEHKNIKETICPVCKESYSNTKYEYCPIDGTKLEIE